MDLLGPSGRSKRLFKIFFSIFSCFFVKSLAFSNPTHYSKWTIFGDFSHFYPMVCNYEACNTRRMFLICQRQVRSNSHPIYRAQNEYKLPFFIKNAFFCKNKQSSGLGTLKLISIHEILTCFPYVEGEINERSC